MLAALEYLSVSGLKPTVAGLPCPPRDAGGARGERGAGADERRSSHHGGQRRAASPATRDRARAADTPVRRLLMLQGLARPLRIVSLMSYPGAAVAVAQRPRARDAIRVVFAAPRSALARAAGLYASALSPQRVDAS